MKLRKQSVKSEKLLSVGDYVVCGGSVVSDRFDFRYLLALMAIMLGVIGYFYLFDQKLKESTGGKSGVFSAEIQNTPTVFTPEIVSTYRPFEE